MSWPGSNGHARIRGLVEAHFAGRTSPRAESEMRAHLAACEACRRVYERHWLLAQLDPNARSAEARIALGLGLRERVGSTRSAGRVAAVALPLAAAVLLGLSTRDGSHTLVLRTRDDDRAFGMFARPAVERSKAQAFWIYRVAPHGRPELAQDTLQANEELAFAYANTAEKPYLMLFGVDEHRRVYWFHPGWPEGAPAPSALRAEAGPGPHELPDAVRHEFGGRRLQVYAVFCDRPLAVATVEQRLLDLDGDSLDLGPAALVVRRTFEVKP